MPSQMRVVETQGSIWHIDEDLNRYRRFPKEEKPREKPEWSDEQAGPLQDAVWHDFTGTWWLTHTHLVIQVYVAGYGYGGRPRYITAPLPLATMLANIEAMVADDRP